MLKKSLIFGSAALLLVALITLTGCPTSADDGSSTTITYGHRIYGTNVSPYQAQAAIDNAVAAGEAVVLEDGLIIQPAGDLNFKNAQVRINGRVQFNGGVINMTDAAVSWAPEGIIRQGLRAYIYREGLDLNDKVPAGAWVWFAESPEGIRPTATAAAVREFKLGSKQNYDYSRGGDGVDARTTATGLTRLFVLDKLIVPSEATFPEVVPLPLTLEALGSVDVTGNVPSVVLNTHYIVGTCATLTSSRGATIAVAVDALTGETEIPNVRVETERDITITQAGAAPLTIQGKLTGPGTLTLANATNINVNGGDGNLNVTTAGNQRLFINNTGRTTFSGDLIINGSSTITSGNVIFGGDLTVGLGGLDILGDVTLGNGRTITLNDRMILGAGKTITLQIIPQGSTRTIPAPLLSAAGGNVELSPDGGVVTFNTPNRPRDREADIAGAKAITLSGAGDLVITDGTLQVAPEATFVIQNDLVTNIDGVARDFGYLAAANGGTVSVSAGAGIDIADGLPGAAIVGPFNFAAGNGTVTLGNHQITGSAAGTRLVPGRGSTGTITVTGVGAVTGTLLLEDLDLDLTTYSGITLTNVGDKVTLDKGAKLILLAGENGQPTSLRTITSNSLDAGLSGAYTGLTSNPEAPSRQPILSVAHRGGELRAVDITAIDPGVNLRTKATFN